MTEVPQTPPPVPAAAPFSWGAFIGGLAIALFCGGFANIFVGAMSMGLHNSFLGFLLGGSVGAVLIILGLLGRRGSVPSFGMGLLCGGCVIGLIGGICGASMVGTTFH